MSDLHRNIRFQKVNIELLIASGLERKYYLKPNCIYISEKICKCDIAYGNTYYLELRVLFLILIPYKLTTFLIYNYYSYMLKKC